MVDHRWASKRCSTCTFIPTECDRAFFWCSKDEVAYSLGLAYLSNKQSKIMSAMMALHNFIRHSPLHYARSDNYVDDNGGQESTGITDDGSASSDDGDEFFQ